MNSRCFFEGWRVKLAKYSSPNSLLILLEETGFLKFSIFSTKREILGQIAVEWRQVLAHRKLTMNVEVPDFRGDGAKNMLGVLSLELVVHSYKSRVNYLDQELVQKYVSQKE